MRRNGWLGSAVAAWLLGTQGCTVGELTTALEGQAAGDEAGAPVALTIVDDPGSVALREATTVRSGGGSVAPGAAGTRWTLVARLEISFHTEGRGWVEVASPQVTRIPLQSSAGAGATWTGRLPTGPYGRVRLRLSDATLEPSGPPGDGSSAAGPGTTLGVGGKDRHVGVEKAVGPVSVTPGSRLSLRFDLNSETWLDPEALASGAVSDERVQEAVGLVLVHWR